MVEKYGHKQITDNSFPFQSTQRRDLAHVDGQFNTRQEGEIDLHVFENGHQIEEDESNKEEKVITTRSEREVEWDEEEERLGKFLGDTPL